MRRKETYSQAVDRFFAVGYQVTDAEHRRLKGEVEEARVQLEIAKLKLAERDVSVQSKVGRANQTSPNNQATETLRAFAIAAIS